MRFKTLLVIAASSLALAASGAALAKGKGKGASQSAGADYRSAKSGKYVKKGYAEKNKDTTVREKRKGQ